MSGARWTTRKARTIGQRLRMIRRRRGMGLAVAAGFAGISKQYLSQTGGSDEQCTYPGWVTDHRAACQGIGSLAWLLAQVVRLGGC